MAQIIFNIEDTKIERIKNALVGLYPIPSIEDPENPGQFIPEFTENQWAKESVRRWIVKQVARWEQKQAMDAIAYNEEDDLIT
jgi:hypothetical protein